MRLIVICLLAFFAITSVNAQTPPPCVDILRPHKKIGSSKTMTCQQVGDKIQFWMDCAFGITPNDDNSATNCNENAQRSLNNHCNSENQDQWKTAIGCCATCTAMQNEYNRLSGSPSPTEAPTPCGPKTPAPTPCPRPPTLTPTRLDPFTTPPTTSPTESPTTSPPTTSPTESPTTSPPTTSPTESPTTSPPTTSPTESPTTFKPTRTDPLTPPPTPCPRPPTPSPTTKKPTCPTPSPTEAPTPCGPKTPAPTPCPRPPSPVPTPCGPKTLAPTRQSPTGNVCGCCDTRVSMLVLGSNSMSELKLNTNQNTIACCEVQKTVIGNGNNTTPLPEYYSYSCIGTPEDATSCSASVGSGKKVAYWSIRYGNMNYCFNNGTGVNVPADCDLPHPETGFFNAANTNEKTWFHTSCSRPPVGQTGYIGSTVVKVEAAFTTESSKQVCTTPLPGCKKGKKKKKDKKDKKKKKKYYSPEPTPTSSGTILDNCGCCNSKVSMLVLGTDSTTNFTLKEWYGATNRIACCTVNRTLLDSGIDSNDYYSYQCTSEINVNGACAFADSTSQLAFWRINGGRSTFCKDNLGIYDTDCVLPNPNTYFLDPNNSSGYAEFHTSCSRPPVGQEQVLSGSTITVDAAFSLGSDRQVCANPPPECKGKKKKKKKKKKKDKKDKK